MPQFDRSQIEDLYLLFQMFSGDELHVISEKVFIEKAK